jgi:hypothetical protein
MRSLNNQLHNGRGFIKASLVWNPECEEGINMRQKQLPVVNWTEVVRTWANVIYCGKESGEEWVFGLCY